MGEWKPVIWIDECSFKRGYGGRWKWVVHYPHGKWQKEMIDTYDKGQDTSITVWGGVWYGGRSTWS